MAVNPADLRGMVGPRQRGTGTSDNDWIAGAINAIDC